MTEFAAPLNVIVDPGNAKRVPVLVKLPPIIKLVEVTSTVPAMVKLAQTSPATDAFIVNPAGTTTLSVARGATPVDQLVPVSQAPDAIAVLFATAMTERKSIKIANNTGLQE